MLGWRSLSTLDVKRMAQSRGSWRDSILESGMYWEGRAGVDGARLGGGCLSFVGEAGEPFTWKSITVRELGQGSEVGRPLAMCFAGEPHCHDLRIS